MERRLSFWGLEADENLYLLLWFQKYANKLEKANILKPAAFT